MSNIIQYLDNLDLDCLRNQEELITKAKLGFPFKATWEEPTWNITSSVKQKIRGSDVRKNKNLNFLRLTPNNDEPLSKGLSDIAKALTIFRYINGGQCANNHQNFIDGWRYIHEELKFGEFSITNITPEILDSASINASRRLKEGTAYNIHKAIHEIADILDANKLSKIHLGYRYSGIKRPINTSGIGYVKLDDQAIEKTKSTKMADEKVIEALGSLYRTITASNLADRVRILLVTLSIFTGRRIGEILTMPAIPVQKNQKNTSYVTVYTEKKSQGDTLLKKEFVPLATATVELVSSVLNELLDLTSHVREIATYINDNEHADYRILAPYEDKGWMDNNDIKLCFGYGNGVQWARNRNLRSIKHPLKKRNSSICWPISEIKKGMDQDVELAPTLIAAGFVMHHKDSLAILPLMACHTVKPSIIYATSNISWQQISDFLGSNKSRRVSPNKNGGAISAFDRYLSFEQAQTLKVNSHAFRHSMNTWLDEGGLSDLAQTTWFGRKNPRDTKAYQHTSPAKAALMVRKDLLEGKIAGPIAKQMAYIPIDRQEAYLQAKIKSVLDVGPGICLHDISQTPCVRSLQCSANCDDFHWRKDDVGRDDDLKRQFAITTIARDVALDKAKTGRGKSLNWLNHNQTKLDTLKQQMIDRGLGDFKAEDYDFGGEL